MLLRYLQKGWGTLPLLSNVNSVVRGRALLASVHAEGNSRTLGHHRVHFPLAVELTEPFEQKVCGVCVYVERKVYVGVGVEGEGQGDETKRSQRGHEGHKEVIKVTKWS